MAKTRESPIVHMIRRLTEDYRLKSLPDQELLRRFTSAQEEAAFAALVRRHGPMVLDVCRNAAGNEADAEDAFQATFLVLARKAKSIRNTASVGSWLHGVAYRTALQARKEFARRRKHESHAPRSSGQESAGDPPWSEVQQLIHAELTAIAESYRAPLVLCFLEGRTQDEAAQQLHISKSTLRKRLERGRALLRMRLVRRGLGPAALLAACSGPAATASACLPPTLASAAVKAATAFATGQATAGLVSAQVSILVANAFKATLATKLTIATIVLLAASLFTGAAVRIHQTFAGSEKEAAALEKSVVPASAKKEPAKPPTPKDDENTATFAGRVLGPDKKGVAGAKVYYHFITHVDEPISIRATTDREGRFSFTLTTKDVPLSAETTQTNPLKTGHVVAKAEGYTIAWLFVGKSTRDLTLHMATDAMPIRGRVVDLEGKPLAGLRVSSLSAWASEKGDLSGFLKAMRSGDTLYDAGSKHLPNVLASMINSINLGRFLPSTTTGADGRFRLPGFGKELLIEMRIEGPSIETQNLYVLTGTKPSGTESLLTFALTKPGMYGPPNRALVRWNGFDHAAPPGQVVTGTVRDEATKAAIPGAIVESYMLAGTNLAENTIYRTVADANGYYRFIGLPRGKGNQVRVRPPHNLPYLPVVKDVPLWKASATTTLDVALPHGVWVDVSAKDKATGKSIVGSVGYFVLPELPSKDLIFDRPFAHVYSDFIPTRTDGTLRFVALPRRAIVAFRAEANKYPIPAEAATIELPGSMPALNYQALLPICPHADDKPVKVEFILDRGGVAKGKLVGPKGHPIVGALAAGLRDDWFWDSGGPLQADEFTALGLKPEHPRLLCFVHEEMKLAGSLVVHHKEKGPITVSLMPWGAVSGRLLDVAGKPIKNATLQFTQVPRRKSGAPMSLDTGLYVVFRSAYKPHPEPHTDEAGRFHVDRLVSGLKYNLALIDQEGATSPDQVKWLGLAFSNLVLQTGETKDLGDVRLQAFPKEKMP